MGFSTNEVVNPDQLKMIHNLNASVLALSPAISTIGSAATAGGGTMAASFVNDYSELLWGSVIPSPETGYMSNAGTSTIAWVIFVRNAIEARKVGHIMIRCYVCRCDEKAQSDGRKYWRWTPKAGKPGWHVIDGSKAIMARTVHGMETVRKLSRAIAETVKAVCEKED